MMDLQRTLKHANLKQLSALFDRLEARLTSLPAETPRQSPRVLNESLVTATANPAATGSDSPPRLSLLSNSGSGLFQLFPSSPSLEEMGSSSHSATLVCAATDVTTPVDEPRSTTAHTYERVVCCAANREAVVQHHFAELGRGAEGVVYRGRYFSRAAAEGNRCDGDGVTLTLAAADDFELPVAVKEVHLAITSLRRLRQVRAVVEACAVLSAAGVPVCYAIYADPDPTSATTMSCKAPNASDNGVTGAKRHPTENCVSAGGATETTAPSYMLVLTSVTELLERGTLADQLHRLEAFSESDVRIFLRDLLPAIAAMHAAGIVHNDIKPLNIMLGNTRGCGDSAAPHGQFKLIDFISSDVKVPMETVWQSLLTTPLEELLQASSRSVFRGTTLYMSPEACLGFHGAPSNDVWALGITLVYMLTGRLPWTNAERLAPSMVLSGFRRKFKERGYFVHPDELTKAPAHLAEDAAEASGAGSGLCSDHGGPFHVHEADITAGAFGPLLDDFAHDSLIGPQAKDLVLSCLVENPFRRATVRTLLRHPFLLGELSSSSGA